VFGRGAKAIRTGIFGVEFGMLLPDKVPLRGNPETIPKSFLAGIRLNWGDIPDLG
jgi:hypothetical protein